MSRFGSKPAASGTGRGAWRPRAACRRTGTRTARARRATPTVIAAARQSSSASRSDASIPRSIEAAADGVQKTPLGVPVTKIDLPGRALYPAETSASPSSRRAQRCSGNQTGIRRALDRIKEGHGQAPARTLGRKGAEPELGAVRVWGRTSKKIRCRMRCADKLAVLDGVETLSGVGKLCAAGCEPGWHARLPRRGRRKNGSRQGRRDAGDAGHLHTIFGLARIPQPVRKLEADAVGKEGHFVAGIDAVAFAALLTRLDDLLGRAAQSQPRARVTMIAAAACRHA